MTSVGYGRLWAKPEVTAIPLEEMRNWQLLGGKDVNSLERQMSSHWRHLCFPLAMQRAIYIFNACEQKDPNSMVRKAGGMKVIYASLHGGNGRLFI